MTGLTKLYNRSDLIGAPIVDRSDAKKLGIVNQLWADPTEQRVSVLGIRKRLVVGQQHYVQLRSIDFDNETGWVDNGAIAHSPPLDQSLITVVGCEVITEVGEYLGKVRDLTFDPETGNLCFLVIDALGLPQIPVQLVSAYRLPVEKISSTTSTRIVVFEGTDCCLKQLTVGIREQMGWYMPPWQAEEDFVVSKTMMNSQTDPIWHSDLMRELSEDDFEYPPDPSPQVWDDGNWTHDEDLDGPAASAIRRPKGPTPTPNDAAETPPKS
ncbi:MAG: PRC-barrel domain-containing protein [Thermosynechococcaceae cyanobacterium]